MYPFTLALSLIYCHKTLVLIMLLRPPSYHANLRKDLCFENFFFWNSNLIIYIMHRWNPSSKCNYYWYETATISNKKFTNATIVQMLSFLIFIQFWSMYLGDHNHNPIYNSVNKRTTICHWNFPFIFFILCNL